MCRHNALTIERMLSVVSEKSKQRKELCRFVKFDELRFSYDDLKSPRSSLHIQ